MSPKKSFLILFPVLALLLVSGCNLEKEIDISLPEYESKLAVECYLEPGQPFFLLLSQTAAYFDPFPGDNEEFLDEILIDGATVTITLENEVFQLNNSVIYNPFTRKVFNYHLNKKIPEDFDHDFILNITTKEGETITATTRILKPVPIDSIVVDFNETDTLARVLTYFTDIPGEDNYYRRMLHHSTLDSIPEQDFTADDRFVEDVFVFGTGYDYAPGDTVFNTVFHLDKTYFEFLESVNNAENSNGNPFGQPNPIISQFGGTAKALGIFTGLSYDRVRTIIDQ